MRPDSLGKPSWAVKLTVFGVKLNNLGQSENAGPVLINSLKLVQIVVLSLVMLLQVACTDKESDQDSSAVQVKSAPVPPVPTYQSTGDLTDITQHGTLRLLAPRFDGADALPRDGLPVLDYQALAEEFAAEQQLKIQWVFVEGFADLIPHLLEGKGDIIVTNLTYSKSRAQQLAFTREITQVNEWLISAKNLEIKDLQSVKKISIPIGTVYGETLKEVKYNGEIELLPSTTSDDDILRGMELGQFQASIFDSDVARNLLSEYPKLERKLSVKKNRPIAWGVRKNNPALLSQLNKFLISHSVRKSANLVEPLAWEAIKARGKLRLLTLNNPASYFMYRGELMGFDYELVKKFADENKLHLAIIIKNDIPDLLTALKKGEGDLIAASLSDSQKRANLGFQFTRPYLKVSEQIVGRADGLKVTKIEELDGHSLGANPDTVFFDKLTEIQKSVNDLTLLSFPGESTETLIERMVEKEFDFAVADSHLIAIEQTYHQNIDIQFELAKESSLVWVVRDDQDELKKQLDLFIKKTYRGLFYNVLRKKYFENPKKIKRYQDGRVFADGSLSPYDNLVKLEAEKYGMDWRLLVSQMYQESKFNTKARSFAGARGLLQVLPRTAKEFGYSDLYKPENGIAAGVSYMHWLEDRFKGEIELEEKIYFVLASYNAGTGHVRDARKLAETLGYDPNKWFNNVERAMLLLSKPEYYKKARFGYVRGSEPVEYVRSIRSRYLSYLSIH